MAEEGTVTPVFTRPREPTTVENRGIAYRIRRTFWDFVSLHTEATHHVMWNMSDRGIPRSIGKMTPNRNPTNYFGETEQVAFHTGHLVPGIEVTNDPLMQARLFSYLDTQLTRLGGPNFAQLPINRPHCPVNDMLRDGMHQLAIHDGVSPYLRNGIDNARRLATADEGAYVQSARVRHGRCPPGKDPSGRSHSLGRLPLAS